MNRFEAPQSYGRRERFPEVATGGPQYQIMLAMECANHFLSSAASRDAPVCHDKAPTVRVPTSCTSLHALHGRQSLWSEAKNQSLYVPGHISESDCSAPKPGHISDQDI